MDYIESINNFIPLCKQEEEDKKIILNLYKKYGDFLLDRKCKDAHFSSSAIVLDKNKEYVLFAYHNIYKSWSWLGGHVDLESDFFQVADKEIREESGIKNIKPISNKIISIEVLPVQQHIKNGKLIKEHIHLNVSYVFIGDKNDFIQNKPDENSDVKWIKVDDIDKYCSEEIMKPIYHKIINRVR